MVGSAFSVVFMFYHPVVRAKSLADLVDEFARQAFFNGMVHGSLIALLGLIVLGLSYLSTQLGWWRPTVRAAFICFCLGASAMTTAALLSGFIIPEFVESHRPRSAHDVKTTAHGHGGTIMQAEKPEAQRQHLLTMVQVMRLARAGNQVCSRVGVLCSALAFVLWSLALWGQAGAARWLSWFGILAGTALAATLLAGLLPMDVHGMLAFVGVQSIWCLAAGWLLWRGRM